MSLLPISACLIARDAEDIIEEAIRSVDFVSEVILVVDSRSRDHTPRVAVGAALPRQELKIIHRQWDGHIAQKNFAVDQARQEWVLCLDADERVSPELRREIAALFEGSPGQDGYWCPRKTYYLGKWIRHGGWYPDRKLRLFRRTLGRWGGIDPHDRVLLDGTPGELRGGLVHRSYRNIRDHIARMDRYASIAAGEMKRRGVGMPVSRMVLHPPAKFFKMYVFRLGFLDGFPGMVVAVLGAFSVFLKYARLWEIIDLEDRMRRAGAVPLEADVDGEQATGVGESG